jgi:hypothetical protein
LIWGRNGYGHISITLVNEECLIMAQNRSYDPPITSPPETPPRTILQVDTQSEVSEWGAIPKVVPKPEGGVPLQPNVVGKTNNN